MHDLAIPIRGYPGGIYFLLLLVGELQGQLHEFTTAYARRGPLRNGHCNVLAEPATQCLTYVEKRKTLVLFYVLALPILRREIYLIASVARLAVLPHR